MEPERKQPDHIHTPEDGRGFREVFLDGKKIEKVCYADTRNGVVRQHLQPYEIDPSTNKAKWQELRGRVEVKPKEVAAP